MKRLNRLTGERLSAAFCSSDAHISVFPLLFAARLNFLLLFDLCDSTVFVRRPEAALCDSVCEFSSRHLFLLPSFTKAISPASLRCFHYRWEQAGTVCWRKITACPSSIITLRDRRCDAGAHRRVTLLENQPNRPTVTQRKSSQRQRWRRHRAPAPRWRLQLRR